MYYAVFVSNTVQIQRTRRGKRYVTLLPNTISTLFISSKRIKAHSYKTELLNLYPSIYSLNEILFISCSRNYSMSLLANSQKASKININNQYSCFFPKGEKTHLRKKKHSKSGTTTSLVLILSSSWFSLSLVNLTGFLWSQEGRSNFGSPLGRKWDIKYLNTNILNLQ